MAATSLKLTDELKRRLSRLAAAAGQTPHAYMIATLQAEVARAELRAQFERDADESEAEVMASGTAYPLEAAFDYLKGRVRGRQPRRPRARPWRASK
jgi:predicted transcriptional regulator